MYYQQYRELKNKISSGGQKKGGILSEKLLRSDQQNGRL